MLGALGTAAGCHCRPDPSVPDDSDPPPDTGRTVPTADTAPEPACPTPESEPNNTAVDADVLTVDVDACGWFQAPNDPDFWAFDVVTEDWLGVWADARENGSLANPGVFLQGPGFVVQRDDGDETADARLLFPAPTGSYTITLREQGFQGEDDGRWFYDLQATVQKAPRLWTTVELEPNDARTDGTPLAHGDAAFGVIADPDDEDWYAVTVPTGRHTVTAWIDAFAMGSPTNARLYLRDADGVSPGCGSTNAGCQFDRGPIGFETDPWLEHTSEGDEVLYVRVVPEDDRGSPIHWYVIELSVVGAE